MTTQRKGPSGLTAEIGGILALRYLPARDGDYVRLLYGTTAGDGFTGLFLGSTGPAGTFVDDGLNVFTQPGSDGSSAWVRQYEMVYAHTATIDSLSAGSVSVATVSVTQLNVSVASASLDDVIVEEAVFVEYGVDIEPLGDGMQARIACSAVSEFAANSQIWVESVE